MNIIDKLNELGYTTITNDFCDYVARWKSWYQGDVKSFHHYKVRTGKDVIRCERYSLGMAKKVAEDWASLLMNEKVKITLEGQNEQDFVDYVLANNNFRVKSNEMQETVFALGTGAFVLRVVGAVADENGRMSGNAEGLEIDYVTAEHIFPLSWRNGRIINCAFSSTIVSKGQQYLYLQIHKLTETGYDIENRVFNYVNNNVGNEITNMYDIPEFHNVPPLVHTGSDKPHFIINRPNIANNIDFDCPLGISVYANAIDVLKGVDITYDSYVNEFQLGKKRIMVTPAATEYLDGEPVFDADDLIFYVLPEETSGESAIKEIDMTLRTSEHDAGIQTQLNILSSKCGFGENHYRFNQGSVATATQVISENSALFRTLKKHEIILETCLIDLCRLILHLGNIVMNKKLNEDVTISIDFDDSIIEDKTSEFSHDMQLLNAGILNDWEFRAKWLNEDETTAKKALPGMEDMTK